MTELLDDYTKATFPLDIDLGDMHHARLLATDGVSVVGVFWYGDDFRIEAHAHHAWRGDGRWLADPNADAIMHLPPPPALVSARIAEYEAEIASCQARLDANLDAPEAWRKADEVCIGKLQRMIAALRPEPKPLDLPPSA